MAARKQLWHPDEVRRKIQASQLINRLTDHAVSEKPLMDGSQVTAALGLLKKAIPDLSAATIEHSGTIETSSKEQRDAAVAAATRANS